MKASEWHERHFEPLNARYSTADTDGLDGDALDALLALKEIEGEELTDYECLLLANDVLRMWRSVWDKNLKEEAKTGWGNM